MPRVRCEIRFETKFAFFARHDKIKEAVGEPAEWAKAHFFVAHCFQNLMANDIQARIQEIAERVGASEGIEIVEVEVKGTGGNRLVRISIDKSEGVSHGDCETISQQVGTILDVEDVVPGGRYTLEVSSPGVERKLFRLRDFERFAGHKARVRLRQPVEGSRHLEGKLAGIHGGKIRMEVGPDHWVDFDLGDVERANLKFEWGSQA